MEEDRAIFLGVIAMCGCVPGYDLENFQALNANRIYESSTKIVEKYDIFGWCRHDEFTSFFHVNVLSYFFSLSTYSLIL